MKAFTRQLHKGVQARLTSLNASLFEKMRSTSIWVEQHLCAQHITAYREGHNSAAVTRSREADRKARLPCSAVSLRALVSIYVCTMLSFAPGLSLPG